MAGVPELLVSASEASEALRAQIEDGERLVAEVNSATGWQTDAAEEGVDRRFQVWDRRNELLLRKLFSGDEVTERYQHSKPIMRTADAQSRLRALRARLNGAIAELEATRASVDLLPISSIPPPVASTSAQRDAYFAELCKRSGGRTDVVLSSTEIGAAVGLTASALSDVEAFLVAEGLIELVTFGPTVRLTHAGRLRSERGLSASSTNIAQSGQTVIVMGDVRDSTIQQAGHDASSTTEITTVYEAARGWLDEVKTRLDDRTLTIPDDLRREAGDLVDLAEAELVHDQPDRKRLRAALRALGSVLENTAGSLVASGLLAGLPEILKAL